MGHSCCYGERLENGTLSSTSSPEEKEALVDARSKLRFHLSANNNPTNSESGFGSLNVSK